VPEYLSSSSTQICEISKRLEELLKLATTHQSVEQLKDDGISLLKSTASDMVQEYSS